jgi:hypothetical protein
MRHPALVLIPILLLLSACSDHVLSPHHDDHMEVLALEAPPNATVDDQQYEMLVLGGVRNNLQSRASGINSAGLVVGEAQDRSGVNRPARWQVDEDGNVQGPTFLPTPSNSGGSARTVNSQGLILSGRSVWDNGNNDHRTSLAAPDGLPEGDNLIATYSASGINDAGTVVGELHVREQIVSEATGHTTSITIERKGLVWREPLNENVAPEVLAPLPGDEFSRAVAVNNVGRILGASGRTVTSYNDAGELEESVEYRLVYWELGNPEDPVFIADDPGRWAFYMYDESLNDLNEVARSIGHFDDGSRRGEVIRGQMRFRLNPLPGYLSSTAYGITNPVDGRRFIFGDNQAGSQRVPVVWALYDNGEVIGPFEIPESGHNRSWVFGSNEQRFVGVAHSPGNVELAVLWRPVGQASDPDDPGDPDPGDPDPGDPIGDEVRVTEIEYSRHGGHDRHLRVHVTLDGDDVASVAISIALSHEGSPYGSGTATTGSSGTATFTFNNAPVSGCFTTVVTSVDADWDGETPLNGSSGC